MENARKLADCYFYYYSTCTKGEACNFRHEPEALGCESMCFYWQQGKCFDQHCKLRHMELRKNRKQIPCYWETQPGGCRKKHCPFMHKSPQPRIDGLAPPQPGSSILAGREGQQQGVNRETGEGPPLTNAGVVPPSLHPSNTQNTHTPNWQRQVSMEPAMLRGGGAEGMPPLACMNPISPMAPINSMTPLAAAYSALQPVDSLVVNFEEESDSESVSSVSLWKSNVDESKHCLDLMRLEEIQEETAAYYSYDPSWSTVGASSPTNIDISTEGKFTGRKLPTEYESMTLDEIHGRKGEVKNNTLDDFKVLTLEEIRERKRQRLLCNSNNINISDFTGNVKDNSSELIHKNVNTISNVESNRLKLKRKISNDSQSSNNIDNSKLINVDLGKIQKLDRNESENIHSRLSFSSQRNNNLMSDSHHVLMRANSDIQLSNNVPDLVKCCTRQVSSVVINNDK